VSEILIPVISKNDVEARFSRVTGAESFEDSSDALWMKGINRRNPFCSLQGERVGYNG